MNPSVGTFISMDSYDGLIDDPVSLHKYLYANANPVSNGDPSGYFTLADSETSSGIMGQLSKMISQNAKAMLDSVGGIFDVVRDTGLSIYEGIQMGLKDAELVKYIASGFLTSLVTNLSCIITGLPEGVGYILMGVAALVIGIVAVVAFAEGNTEMGLAQVANIVSIVFSMFRPTCFTGGTEVYTDSGLVCIEDIEVGDKVWAYNPETGETELKEVLNVWVKETDEILHVTTSDGETIDTTTNHPFYVENKGWVAAGDLDIGDTLVTADGDEVEVTDLELEKLAEPITVYNLEVEDFNTYFVGEFGVLVHNYDKAYRVIRDDEDITKGLMAKNPSANYSVTGHVINGSRIETQFISVTTDKNVAKKWAAKDGKRIVSIDMNKLLDGTKIYDLSTDVGRSKFLNGIMAKNFAKASSEMLIEGYIPSEALTLVF